MRLLLLAAAQYVEVLPSPGPYVLDRVHTALRSTDDVKGCMARECGTEMNVCMSAGTCAGRLNHLWHKVLFADMTAPETDLMGCMLHHSCLEKTSAADLKGWHGRHGAVHRVHGPGGRLFAWRQPRRDAARHGPEVELQLPADKTKAETMAVLASSLQCPGVVPVVDEHPAVTLRSGEVVKDGFVMPLMDGTLNQWLQRQTKASSNACLDHVAMQAGGAIACLHARGYTYGDVHDGNFLYKSVPGGCPQLGVVDFERMAKPEGPATGRAGVHDWEKLATMLHRLENPEQTADNALATPPQHPLTQALLAGVALDQSAAPGGPRSHAEQAMRDFILQHA